MLRSGFGFVHIVQTYRKLVREEVKVSYLCFFALGFPPSFPVQGNVSLQQGGLGRKVAEMLLRGTKKHLDFSVLNGCVFLLHLHLS